MAELRLNSEMNLLSTRYRVRSDCACRFKRQKWMVEVLRETSSDIGRIGPKGHERELLILLKNWAYGKRKMNIDTRQCTRKSSQQIDSNEENELVCVCDSQTQG